MNEDHLSLKGFSSIGEALLSEQLECNLTSYFQWGMLGKGSFLNVTIPTSGAYGGNQHQLRLLADPNYNEGQVWQAFRQDWVWETGVNWAVQPIRVSGVRVNNVFYPKDVTGAFAHKIDYPQGRVVFDTAISTSSTVTCEYSYRYGSFITADNPWWREVQFNSLRVDDSHFSQTGSGAWSTVNQSRVQLPAVVVEVSPRTERVGLEVGSLVAVVKQDVLLHVLAETPFEKKKLHDVLTYQWQKRLLAFDKNIFLSPLDEYGSPLSSGTCYPHWVRAEAEGGYGWDGRRIRFIGVQSIDQRSLGPLQHCTIRLVCEVDVP